DHADNADFPGSRAAVGPRFARPRGEGIRGNESPPNSEAFVSVDPFTSRGRPEAGPEGPSRDAYPSRAPISKSAFIRVIRGLRTLDGRSYPASRRPTGRPLASVGFWIRTKVSCN